MEAGKLLEERLEARGLLGDSLPAAQIRTLRATARLVPGGAGASGGDDVDDVASVLRTPGGAGAAPAQRERRYAGPSI